MFAIKLASVCGNIMSPGNGRQQCNQTTKCFFSHQERACLTKNRRYHSNDKCFKHLLLCSSGVFLLSSVWRLFHDCLTQAVAVVSIPDVF